MTQTKETRVVAGRLVLKGRDLGDVRAQLAISDDRDNTWDVWLTFGWVNDGDDEVVAAHRVVSCPRVQSALALGRMVVCVWEFRGEHKKEDAWAAYQEMTLGEILRVEETHEN